MLSLQEKRHNAKECNHTIKLHKKELNTWIMTKDAAELKLAEATTNFQHACFAPRLQIASDTSKSTRPGWLRMIPLTFSCHHWQAVSSQVIAVMNLVLAQGFIVIYNCDHFIFQLR